jgi:hypothetical protein
MKRRLTKKTSPRTNTTPWDSKPPTWPLAKLVVEAIRQAMAGWRRFRPSPYEASKGIQLGALVCMVDSDDEQQQLFLGPDGGSMKLVSERSARSGHQLRSPVG